MSVDRTVAATNVEVAAKTRPTPRLAVSVGRTLVLLVLLGGVVLTAIPYIYMVSATFKPNTEIFAFPITLWPRNVTLFNYQQLFQEFPFFPLVRQHGPRRVLSHASVRLSLRPGRLWFCEIRLPRPQTCCSPSSWRR